MTLTAGYDVGGAHVKVALAADGRVMAARQIPCALWKGIDRLSLAFDEAIAFSGMAERHVFTMTGELSDLFSCREEGVAVLLGVIAARFGEDARIWAGPRAIMPLADARPFWRDIASTNFLASAVAVGRLRQEALLLDIGSTTADIISVREGRPVCRGLSDAERLANGELVYTGLTRTPLMAIAGRAPFRGVWQGLTREYFATAADMRRIIGDLPEDVDQHDTADGRDVSPAHSIARFARMFGRDASEGSLEDWRLAAAFLAETQLRDIVDAALQILSAAGLPDDTPVVTAGIGAGLAGEAARRLGRPAIFITDLLPCAQDARLWAGRCAPATALAWIDSRELGDFGVHPILAKRASEKSALA